MKLVFILNIILLSSCANSLVNLSKRNLLSNPSSNNFVKKRKYPSQKKVDEDKVFLKKESINIRPKSKVDNAGSLFVESNPANYLFFPRSKGQVGDILTVYTRPTRGAAINDKKPTDDGNAQNEQANKDQGAEMDADQLEKELLSALPQFESEKKDVKPLTKINFKVLKRLPNGDVIVETTRGSESRTQSNLIRAKALIKSSSLNSIQPLTTDQLSDITWLQVQNGEANERESTSWEDEYTLRLSGFEEAKSKTAIELEKKRKDLMDLRDRLQKRISSLSRDRQQVANERANIKAIKDELNAKIESLNEQLKEKDAVIDEQKNIIKKQEEVMGNESSGNEESNGLQNL